MYRYIFLFTALFIVGPFCFSFSQASQDDGDWRAIELSQDFMNLNCEEDFKPGREVHVVEYGNYVENEEGETTRQIKKERYIKMETMAVCKELAVIVEKTAKEQDKERAKERVKYEAKLKEQSKEHSKRISEAEKRLEISETKKAKEGLKTVQSTANGYSICHCNATACLPNAYNAKCAYPTQCTKVSESEYFTAKSDRSKVLTELGPKRFCLNLSNVFMKP